MAVKDIIYEALKVKTVTVLDFEDFYKKLWRWFNYNNYGLTETEYRDIDVAGGGKQLEIRWEASKEVDSYASYVITADFLILNMKDVEIERNGIKTKLNKATYELRLTAYVEKDPGNKFSGPFMSRVRHIYDKYIIRTRMEDYREKLREEADAFIGEVKSFFGLHGSTF
ncbi:MAG: hypothetical protein AABW87_01225 [Nanoarchaeota archaeon]